MIFVILVLSVVVVYFIFDYFRKLSSIPSAPGRSLLFGHLWMIYQIAKQDNCSLVEALSTFMNEVRNDPSAKHGMQAIYLGPYSVVHITSPEVAEQVVNIRQQDWSVVYSCMPSAVGAVGKGIPSMGVGEEHKYHRKLLTPFYRFAAENLTERVDTHFHKFMDAIGDDGILKDVYASCKSLTDGVSSKSLGLNLDPMFYETQNERWEETTALIEFSLLRYRSLLTCCALTFAFSKKGREHLHRKTKGYYPRMVEEAMQRFECDVEDRSPTLLNLLIQEHLRNPHKLTKQDIIDELILEWIGTVYATTFALTFILHELGHRPDIQEKLFSELNKVLSPGQDLTKDVLDKLPYLNAVVREGLRKHPTVPSLSPWMRSVDTKISKTNKEGVMTIPAFTLKFVNTKAVNHDPRHWKNPEEFYPERFLQDKQAEHPFSFLSFGKGLRECPGKKGGYLALAICLAKIIQGYTIQSLNPLGSIRKTYTPPSIEVHAMKFTERI